MFVFDTLNVLVPSVVGVILLLVLGCWLWNLLFGRKPSDSP